MPLWAESRIHGDVYVRFGGRLSETYHRKVAWRRQPSLRVIYLCAGLLLLFLLYDTPVRRNLKLMPYWKSFAGEVKQGIWRMRNRKI